MRCGSNKKREVPLLHPILPLQEYHDAHHDRMDDHLGHHVFRRRSDVPSRHVHVLRRRGVIFIVIWDEKGVDAIHIAISKPLYVLIGSSIP